MSDLIRLDAVSRRFTLGGSEVAALDRVSLRVAEGEYLAVMGPSGSGKSTLLNVLGLLDRPDEGRYWLGGEDTATLSEPALAQLRGHRIGFVFQSFLLLPTMTALENVMLPAELRGERDCEPRARELLAAVGLGERLHHLPPRLSGGEQQRVAIARAFMTRPSLLLADEPTGNLDSKTGEKVIELLFELNRKHGTTLVVVTHDHQLAERCQRQVVMTAGRLDREVAHDVV